MTRIDRKVVLIYMTTSGLRKLDKYKGEYGRGLYVEKLLDRTPESLLRLIGESNGKD